MADRTTPTREPRVVRLGHPALRSPCEPVDPANLQTPEIAGLIADLLAAMRSAGGLGLAAPQLALPHQLFVYGVAGEGPDPPPRSLINPMVEPEAGELVYDWEGCLSVPGLRGLVPRHPRIRVRGLDAGGRPLDFVAEGHEARIIQHEYDHLNGVLFLDRMRDLKSLAFEEEWGEFLAGSEDDPESMVVG